MKKEYEVGRGKPPKHTQFKPGNKAAVGRKAKSKEPFTMMELFSDALEVRRKIKRGEKVVEMAVGEILRERIINTIVSGNGRELEAMVRLLDRYAPIRSPVNDEPFEVVYRRAENSTVELPPKGLWGNLGRD